MLETLVKSRASAYPLPRLFYPRSLFSPVLFCVANKQPLSFSLPFIVF